MLTSPGILPKERLRRLRLLELFLRLRLLFDLRLRLEDFLRRLRLLFDLRLRLEDFLRRLLIFFFLTGFPVLPTYFLERLLPETTYSFPAASLRILRTLPLARCNLFPLRQRFDLRERLRRERRLEDLRLRVLRLERERRLLLK